MLAKFAPHTTLAVSDMERAKAWYRDKLGFEPVSEDPVGAWYESGGATFALIHSSEAGTAKNTVMEWTVEGLEEIAAEMKSRGVSFDTFEMPGLEWDGDIASMGPFKGCWFRDSEGNVLGLTNRVS